METAEGLVRMVEMEECWEEVVIRAAVSIAVMARCSAMTAAILISEIRSRSATTTKEFVSTVPGIAEGEVEVEAMVEDPILVRVDRTVKKVSVIRDRVRQISVRMARKKRTPINPADRVLRVVSASTARRKMVVAPAAIPATSSSAETDRSIPVRKERLQSRIADRVTDVRRTRARHSPADTARAPIFNATVPAISTDRAGMAGEVDQDWKEGVVLVVDQDWEEGTNSGGANQDWEEEMVLVEMEEVEGTAAVVATLVT